MPVYTHTHTHTKNVTMSCCVFCSCWLFTVCWVDDYCIVIFPWTGIRLYQSVTCRDMADMTPCVSFSDIYIWTLLRIWREKQKRGHLWQLEHKLILSLSDSHSVYPTVFSLPLFEIPRSFFFFILTQSVCLAHCQAACLFMCTFELSHNHICVIFICNSAS